MSTQMRAEALQGPQVVAEQAQLDQAKYEEIGRAMREQVPSALVTIARGSSDHAANYAAYLIMARMGRLVTSLPMSIVTLYQAKLQCEGLVSLAFSQSGQSPDLITPTQYLRQGGARTIAWTNDEASPLARAAQWSLPLRAGPERSVAATKSYIAQLTAGARFVQAWQQDAELAQALMRLPQDLEAACQADWSAAVPALVGAERLLVIGRGTSLPVAQEAALKFKETCAIQAEAFSGAEVKHGPMALIDAGYPMLIFAPRGPAQAGLLDLAREMRGKGAQVWLAAPAGTPDAQLPLVETGHPDLDPIACIQSFYLLVEALAVARGGNPDQPRHLSKVTRTH